MIFVFISCAPSRKSKKNGRSGTSEKWKKSSLATCDCSAHRAACGSETGIWAHASLWGDPVAHGQVQRAGGSVRRGLCAARRAEMRAPLNLKIRSLRLGCRALKKMHYSLLKRRKTHFTQCKKKYPLLSAKKVPHE